MSGVYGNMLAYFPELKETLIAYEQRPLVGAGWTPVAGSSVSIVGILQNVGGMRLSSGEEYYRNTGVVSRLDSNQFWSETKLKLYGWFTLVDDVVFRFTSNGSWSKEGGFYVYTLEKVVGNKGTAETAVSIIPGDLT